MIGLKIGTKLIHQQILKSKYKVINSISSIFLPVGFLHFFLPRLDVCSARVWTEQINGAWEERERK